MESESLNNVSKETQMFRKPEFKPKVQKETCTPDFFHSKELTFSPRSAWLYFNGAVITSFITVEPSFSSFDNFQNTAKGNWGNKY